MFGNDGFGWDARMVLGRAGCRPCLVPWGGGGVVHGCTGLHDVDRRRIGDRRGGWVEERAGDGGCHVCYVVYLWDVLE